MRLPSATVVVYGICGQCQAEILDGPFRFCWRCRKIDLKAKSGS